MSIGLTLWALTDDEDVAAHSLRGLPAALDSSYDRYLSSWRGDDPDGLDWSAANAWMLVDWFLQCAPSVGPASFAMRPLVAVRYARLYDKRISYLGFNPKGLVQQISAELQELTSAKLAEAIDRLPASGPPAVYDEWTGQEALEIMRAILRENENVFLVGARNFYREAARRKRSVAVYLE